MAAHADTSHGGRLYWGTWLTLLALTLVMIVVDGLSMPRSIFLSVVLSAMLVKATLIGAFASGGSSVVSRVASGEVMDAGIGVEQDHMGRGMCAPAQHALGQRSLAADADKTHRCR